MFEFFLTKLNYDLIELKAYFKKHQSLNNIIPNIIMIIWIKLQY